MNEKPKNVRFARYAWFLLIANILVILWGAFVRATGSGAGCGAHWPLCNGVVVPRDAQVETLIEFAHRMSSGFVFLLALGLLIWAYRAYPKKHPVRLGATLTMIFMVTEALVGAGLVLFEWVALNASIERVYSISVHLVNTFLLLGANTLTAWWASGGKPVSLKGRTGAKWAFAIGFIGVMVIGVSGAITALGDTLFPAGSLSEGIQQDFAATAHFLVRLRVWHPIIAIGVGFYLLFVSGVAGMSAEGGPVKKFSLMVIGLVFIQWVAGLVNVILLAPVWMQLIHLLLADLVWISWVLLAATLFTIDTSEQSVVEPQPDSSIAGAMVS
jgi:heme A synthase